MPRLEIQVSGHSSMSFRPERGTLSLSVKSEGPELQTVSKEVVKTSNDLNKGFKELSPKEENGTATAQAAVTSFSSQLLRTWHTIPTDKNHNRLPPVYYAETSYRVEFRDFDKLGEVAGRLARHPNVEIDYVTWDLTEATKVKLGSETRQKAMRDAIRKANDYAEVVGRPVVPVEVEDRGQGTSAGAMYRAEFDEDMGFEEDCFEEDDDVTETTEIDLTPRDVEFTGSVDVKFEAVSE